MPGDFTRKTFDRKKHYSGVLMQQGRVQLDADWNEQLEIQQYRTEIEARDVIGICGVPKKDNGFNIGITPDGSDLTISEGRIYVDGLLCELEGTPLPITFVQDNEAVQNNQAVVPTLIVDNRELQVRQWVEVSAAKKKDGKLLQITALDEEKGILTFSDSITDYQNAGAATLCRVTTYITQPDYPNPEHAGLLTSPPSSPPKGSEHLSLSEGAYLVFLDVWKREINALDDPLIREKALGGPDTATRHKNIWQLRLLPVTVKGGQITCETQFAEWNKLIAASTGMMNAQTKSLEEKENPCLLPPQSGYLRLENQLYRVEVHTEGSRGKATFKWSRDNATVETTIEAIDGYNITVADIGKDEVLGFAADQWVEIVDEESTLKGIPHPLVQIDKIDHPETRVIAMKTSVDYLKDKTCLKLRRWDQTGTGATSGGVKMSEDWIDLEDGIQVQFSDGSYHAGDYWLIPARTETGEIEWPPFETPSTRPIPQPPLGIQHHYCRLAFITVKEGVVQPPEDCRALFPPLTNIWAEDVYFDNRNCKLPDAETVQDALDQLCEERNLRFHNKHLHGWGIVCGLQVECGPDQVGQPRRQITVRPGYAIDCEGNDIVIEKDESIDLLAMLEKRLTSPPSSPPAGVEDGDYCLILEGGDKQRGRYSLEKSPPPKKGMQPLLEDTLLMDFYNDCIKSLVDFVIDEFTPDPEEKKLPVGPTQKRITTFINLLIQLFNPENGSYVFLSGEKGKKGKNLEDTILRDFYEKLLLKLKSHTFCAMFETARKFPDYPYQGLDIATLFGKGFHKRLRIHPKSTIGYTFGAGNKINVYDLRKNEMVVEMEFPGGTGAVVQDVAFSKDGRQLYAIAILNNKDSMFGVADIQGFKHDWQKPTSICDVLFLTLGTAGEKVYAIGKGEGLFEINPKNVSVTPTPLYAFKAIGHLSIDEKEGLAFASATDQAGQTSAYNRVLRLNLKTVDTTPPAFVCVIGNRPVSGQDDIKVVFDRTEKGKLYVVIDPPTGKTTKHLLVFDADSGKAAPKVVDLGENTAIRLAYNPLTRFMMLTFEDSYRIGLLNITDDKLTANYRHPVQISPLSIAVAPQAERVFVLNYVSNTLSSIPAKLLVPKNQISLQELVTYRTGVINAFADLLGGVLQYLKDCFCDHLLVKCPTCDGDEKLYLACISIQNNQVYQVCNFSRRRYVKSFPTVGYWLSLIPIVPLLSKAVEKFCCMVLPNFFGKYFAPMPKGSENNLKTSGHLLSSVKMRQAVTFVQQTNFQNLFKEKLGMGKFDLAKGMTTDWFTATVGKEEVAPLRLIEQGDIVGQPVERAREKFKQANVSVDRIERYDPTRGAWNIVQLSKSPVRLEEGQRVTLFEQDGVVRYYALAEEVAAPVKDLRAEVEANRKVLAENKAAVDEALRLREEVNTLKENIARAETTHQEALTTRDKEIAELKAKAKDFEAGLKTVGELKEQVAKLSGRITSPVPRKKKQ